MPTSGNPIHLRALLGRTERTQALMNGSIQSDLVSFEFDDIMPVTKGFPSMVREMPFDFGELALLTALQAKEAGKPLTILPFVLAADYLHKYVHYNSKFGTLRPEDMAGKRIGIRSYTQTTGLWIRGFLEEDHGVPLEKQHWVCFQEPHVVEYKEPSFVERGPQDTTPLEMLINGEVDAVVGLLPSQVEPYPQLKSLFPEGTGEEWSRRKGFLPINHLAVLRTSLHEQNSELAPELFRLLLESKGFEKVPVGTVDLYPPGVEANRQGMELLIRWALRQQLLTDPVDVDSLFDEVTRGLGAT